MCFEKKSISILCYNTVTSSLKRLCFYTSIYEQEKNKKDTTCVEEIKFVFALRRKKISVFDKKSKKVLNEMSFLI